MRKRKRKRWHAHFEGFDNRRQCFYCARPFGDGLRQQTLDHVYPRALGASGPGMAASNVVFACRACNDAKKDMHPKEWGKYIPPEALPRYVRRLKEIFHPTYWHDIDWWHTDLIDTPQQSARQE